MTQFFTALFEGMTATQKGGLIALIGGIILSSCGLAAVSNSNIHIGPDGIDFSSQSGIGGRAVVPLIDPSKDIK